MFNKIRLFTLLPRRFQTHYWDSDNILHFTRWWQWGRRCFFIRDRIIQRPTFSSWDQIKCLARMNDLDAKIIEHLIERSNQKDFERFYNFIIINIEDK